MTTSPLYQGQFGEFTITDSDRREVILYRTGLGIACLSWVLGSTLVLNQSQDPLSLNLLTGLFFSFSLGLGLSLWTIHIYLVPLHRLLQLFWGIGIFSAIGFSVYAQEPLLPWVYEHPLSLFGIGFLFAALTGIFFKEAFCFNRLETKFLTPLVPFLLLGHLGGFLPILAEQILLALWSIFFIIFVVRKSFQAIPPDIGDKSVFSYLKQQKQAS